ncbi:MAG: putative aminopeptidase [Acidimicrobiales bacterium]|nr:putative aminopeptidase [Acidimicrobiales bacterium]
MPERDPNRLPTTVVPSHYDLVLAPDLQTATFTGSEAVAVTVTEPVGELVLHALDLVITAAWLTRGNERLDATVTLDAEAETATLHLSGTAEPGDWTLHALFTGELNDKLVGFYRSTFTDDDGVAHTLATTQFESTHARRAFPCWDEPAYKSTFDITLEVADGLMAVSNAAEIADETIGDGRRRVRFATTMYMSTYLVAFIVGPLEASRTIDVDGVPLRVIAPPGKADLTEFALEVGAFSLRFLSDWYDIEYPGDKLDLVAIPDFSFGAMENLGCVTFRETALLIDRGRSTQAEQQRIADVIAHEIAHMWFGDLVTMSWWNGIWLNEAFATFMEMLTTDAYRPDWERWTDFGLARSAAFDTDSLSTTRPIEYEVITAADSEGMFDVLTYEKGASVVRMLQQYLGEDRFQAGIRHYLKAHAYGNTETTDLWDSIEAATGEPVRQIMDSWIFRPGHPAITVTRTAGGNGLTIEQSRFSFLPDPAAGITAPSEEPRSVPVVLRVGHPSGGPTAGQDPSDGTGTSLHRMLLAEASTTITLEHPAEWVVGNHQGNGFYRVELSDEDLAAVSSRALVDLSPLERYGLVEDEWALLLAGRGSVARILGLLRSLTAETDLSVWQRMVGVLGGLDRVGGDAHDALAARVRALLGPALHALGTIRSPGEPERTTALRATLFEASARIGEDAEQLSVARGHFTALGSDPGAVDADLADAVVRVMAAHADQEIWDELRERAASARTPQDRLRHQGALADSSDPALVRRFCDLILTDEVRTQDGLYLLRRALANRHATTDVWAFVVDHWAELTARFPSASVPRLIDGIRGVTDRELAAAITAFLDAHPVPQGATVIRQHVERMWVTVALAERVPGELAAALA